MPEGASGEQKKYQQPLVVEKLPLENYYTAEEYPAGTHMQEVSIGRVITTERGKGYGKQIMLHAIEAAKKHFDAKQIDIEAQEYAKGFYENVGFKQSSETFMLDGIPHIRMTLRL